MKEDKPYKSKDIFFIPIKNAPLEAMCIILQKLLAGIIPVIAVMITAEFIDTAISIYSKNNNIEKIIRPIIFILLIVIFQWFSQQITKLAQVSLENKLRCGFRCSIIEKVASLEYKDIENKDSCDLISRILKNVEGKCSEVFIDTLEMLSVILKVFGLLLFIFVQVWWATILIVIISVPLFFVSLKGGKAGYEAIREVEKYNRKVNYLDEVLNGRDAVDERSLFGFTESINQQWIETYEVARKIKFKVNLKWFLCSKFSSIATAILSILVVAVLIYPVQSGALTIGMFISIVNNSFSLINILAWQLPVVGNTLSRNREYIKDLCELFALKSNKNELCKPSEEKILLNTLEFNNVSFKYPNTEKYIFKNLSFKIENGKHYAFVGENGTGKTTIVKLITGLYNEFEGDILINGVSIRKHSKETLKSLSTVLYQDFARYSISLKDNILIGDVNLKFNDKYINKVIDTLDLNDIVQKMPKGLETNVGKIKNDGIDLSGGQWQRVAMARLLINNASLRILDEPTAALDPITESKVYEKFGSISKTKTTIFISHRLASTKLADEIFVLEEGKLIEKGTYIELMKKQGVYASMYESQRGWYLQ